MYFKHSETLGQELRFETHTTTFNKRFQHPRLIQTVERLTAPKLFLLPSVTLQSTVGGLSNSSCRQPGVICKSFVQTSHAIYYTCKL